MQCLPIWLRKQVKQTNENEYNVADDENDDDSEYTQIQEINTSLQIVGESPLRRQSWPGKDMPQLN
jgi:hypothetical protein